MPKANWNVSRGTIDDFDRTSRFKPYMGPMPPLGVYRWRIKWAKFVSASKENYPQLRLGCELVPRSRDEKKYSGYFVQVFRSITDRNDFAWVPILDALGVSSTDFLNRTATDDEGTISRIGRWHSDGTTEIYGQLQERQNNTNGKTYRDLDWIGSLEDGPTEEDDEADDESEEEYDDDEYYDDEEDGF